MLIQQKVQIVEADGQCPKLPLVDGGGAARAVVWPGIGAQLRSLHLFKMKAGSRTIEMRHEMEAVYYVIEGTAAALDKGEGTSQRAEAGSMIFVEPHTSYVIVAEDEALEMVGGPCPPDLSLYEHLQ